MSDKLLEILLGLFLSGLVSLIVWLFKVCDRLDRECHDLRRDVAHLQRNQSSFSAASSEDIKRVESERELTSRYFIAINSRFCRVESRLDALLLRGSTEVKTELED